MRSRIRPSAGADGEAIVLHELIDLERGEALWRRRADVEALVAKRFGRPCILPAMHPHEGGGDGGGGAHVDWVAVRATLDVARAAGGSLPVEYGYTARSEGFGRMFAKVAAELPAGSGARLLPCVYMPREVRASLSARDYVDVDFANCQPTLLRQRLDACGIGCPLLARYVDARDAGLAEVAAAMRVDRDTAKQLFVRIVYGGGIEGWARDHGVGSLAAMPAWVRDLTAELRASTSALAALPELEDLRDYHARVHAQAQASGDASPSAPKAGAAAAAAAAGAGAGAGARSTGSVVAIHLQSLEAECVRALVAVARATRREVGSIIHDGVHVRREPGDPPGRLPDGLLERWSAHVLGTTGFSLTLAVKPFEVPACVLGADAPADGEGGVNAHGDAEDAADGSWKDGGRLMGYEDMKRHWERIAFKVEDSGNYCVCATGSGGGRERRIYVEKTLHDSKRHLHYCVAEPAKAGASLKLVRRRFITRWIDDPCIRVYSNIVLCPPPVRTPRGCFNIWSPFEAAELPAGVAPLGDDEAARAVAFFVDFVHVLCGRNETVTKYVLDWVAQMVQQPGVKPGVALLLKGEQGVGKNRFTDLLRALVGVIKFLQTANPSSVLYGRFTRMREGRLLIVVNEASGTDSFAASEVIKDMITCDEFVSEGKGTNAYSIACFARFVFTTNNSNCMRVTADGRRMEIIEASSELRGKAAYFERLSALIADPAACHALYRALEARDISRVNWVNDRPITEFYKSMVQQSLAPEFRFLKAWIIEAHAQTRHLLPECQVAKASLCQLFDQFKAWLVQTSSTGRASYEITDSKFGMRLTDLIVREPVPAEPAGSAASPGSASDGPVTATPPPRTPKATAMRGISKKHEKTGNFYVFQLPLVLNEMARIGWIHEHDKVWEASPMEERFKATLERETGKEWCKVRPDWLRNPETGVPMELDMFCAELATAVEYNGRQHYEFPNQFHSTREQFDAQQRRDRAKAEICLGQSVRLVVIDARASLDDEMEQWRAAVV